MAHKGPRGGVNAGSENKKGLLQYRTQYRILDEAARNRRNCQLLDKLERDNFHEDPHANLVMHKKAPKFEDQAIKPGQIATNPGPGRRPGSHSHHHHKTKQISLAQLLEEDAKSPEPNYHSIAAPPPGKVMIDDKLIMIVNRRHFCCVCGFAAPYTCITCGMRYCCISCLQTHRDTRCLKWTV